MLKNDKKTNRCKVSILMNCFNGERYLKESIDSVYGQRFSDWEIVFIDNCSVDNSANIAKSYGPELKYFNTNHNVPLGEARAYGIERCIGKYLMYLDVDDRYHPGTIKTLLNEIEGTDFLVVYAGHNNINKSGQLIGKYNPKPKMGNIFPDLLNQFDIPTASIIMNLEVYRDINITYDPNIVVSSEYNHFLRLALRHKFKCIPGEIVDYRIHGEGLTYEKQAFASQDRIYTLQKIISKNPEVVSQYEIEFEEAFARADFYKSRTHIAKGEFRSARKLMRKHVFRSKNYFFIYILYFLPDVVRDYVFKKKYSL